MICVFIDTPSWSKAKAEINQVFFLLKKTTLWKSQFGSGSSIYLFIFVGMCFQSKKLCLMLIDCFIAVLLLIGNISAMLVNFILLLTHV